MTEASPFSLNGSDSPNPRNQVLHKKLTDALASTSTCHADLKGEGLHLGPLRSPTARDLVLVEVVKLGYAFGDGFLEVFGDGGITEVHKLEVGSTFIAALGDREAQDEFNARIPRAFDGEYPIIDVAAGCGLVSVVRRATLEPTKVRVLGAVHRNDQPLRAEALEFEGPAIKSPPMVFLFVADKMNAGKSTAVLACTRALVAAGSTVVVGKITGTAKRRSMTPALEAGATAAYDFSDFGYPSTKNLSDKELDDLLDRAMEVLTTKADGGYVLLELADGFRQAETKMIMKRLNSRPVDRIVLCLSGTGSKERSRVEFKKFHNDLQPPDAISGRIVEMDEHTKYLQQVEQAANIPMFNALTIDTNDLKSLLVGDSAGGE